MSLLVKPDMITYDIGANAGYGIYRLNGSAITSRNVDTYEIYALSGQ